MPAGIAVFGEVLFDIFPDGARILGGAPFNVAWHLQALGLGPRLVSRVGDDAAGREAAAAMRAWGLSVSELQIDATHPTGGVTVALNAGEPSYAILDKQAYDFISAPDSKLAPQWLYFGSLALRNPVARESWAKLRRRAGETFLDVNLRAPWWRREDVLGWMEEADWVKLNVEEFCLLFGETEDLPAAMALILERLSLRGLVVTCGAEGAWGISAAEGEVRVEAAAFAPVVDCVGAGDGFSAVLLAGLSLGWPFALNMRRARDFAAAVVGIRGATAADSGFYAPFLADWGLRPV